MAVVALFEWTFHKDVPLQARVGEHVEDFEELLSDQSDTKKDASSQKKHFDSELFSSVTGGVFDHKEQIDKIIKECAPEWPLDQISRADLSILRIAIFELLHRQSTPTKVAIDEAVELAKEFGGMNSSKFVNGVLGTVVKRYVTTEEEPTGAADDQLASDNQTD